jgi:hypothetical protein
MSVQPPRRVRIVGLLHEIDDEIDERSTTMAERPRMTPA